MQTVDLLCHFLTPRSSDVLVSMQESVRFLRGRSSEGSGALRLSGGLKTVSQKEPPKKKVASQF